ncbi:HNH endonuclease [Brenneria sp. g21c3]|uniref:HNH endonuclease n=1 Tax=Brenneria sp. g21c3 TaxID=3093893 RepID=UPI002EB34608|nr:HNH endonuclease [Brenneria sp. g21c3]
MNTAVSIHKNIGYEIMQYLHDAFIGSELNDINENGCYQYLKLGNGCSIRYTKWRDGTMPFYIILFNNKGRYIFELDLSMLIYNNECYYWHLKSPQNKTTLDVVNKKLNEPVKLSHEYIDLVKNQKELLSSGINTPKNGFYFLSNVSWDILTKQLLNLVSLVFEGHDFFGLEINNNYSYSEEADNDNNEYEIQRRRTRKGQLLLKRKLLEVYGASCSITGCETIEVLEAAHIISHAESGINHSENALLLRADIHILFDRNLLKIDPENFKIILDDSLKNTEYWNLNGKKLRKRSDGKKPSVEYLRKRWESWHD